MQKMSATKIIVGIAIFSALSFGVSYLEFAIFPSAPFLRFDFSSVFTLLAGFVYGPVAGVAVCAVKEAFCMLKSSTGFIGELANFLITCSFILLPTILYKYKKGLKTVIVSLAFAVVIQTAVALLVNRYINFPLYMGETAKTAFDSLWYFVLAFNVIKGVVVSCICTLLYKRVSSVIKRL